MAENSEIEAMRQACEDETFQAACQRYAHGNGTSMAIMVAARTALEKVCAESRDAERYRWLRERDLDTIDAGGVFAGQTPPDAIEEIRAERNRQIAEEGWTTEHDDQHNRGELPSAAACYAWFAGVSGIARETIRSLPASRQCDEAVILNRLWPWEPRWWKPRDRRRDLIRAAALIVAEIERLDRLLDGREHKDNG